MIMMPYGWTLALAAAHRSGGLLAPYRRPCTARVLAKTATLYALPSWHLRWPSLTAGGQRLLLPPLWGSKTVHSGLTCWFACGSGRAAGSIAGL